MKFQKVKITVTLLIIGMTSIFLLVFIFMRESQKSSLESRKKELKNVILMIADGWGSNHILATDYFTEGKVGMKAYEKFPIRIYMSTYSLGNLTTDDDLVSKYSLDLWSNFNLFRNYPTDSAAAGTAMSTGKKTYNAAIGIDQGLKNLRHISEDFEADGRSTGVVTSVVFSHATPASFIAHNPDRNNYEEIANEMIKNSATDVIMGTGNPFFDDNGMSINTPNYTFVGGQSTWDSLVAGTLGNDSDNDGISENWTFIQTEKEFEALQTGKTPSRLIGIPQVFLTLQQARSGNGNADAYKDPFNDGVPNLAVMAKGALNVLDDDKDGFFLLIEGGAIDWASHANQSGRLIEELEDFNTAVEAVCDWVEHNSSWDETLLIVTGDHETGYLTGTYNIYDEVKDNGKNIMPTMSWNSQNHTNQLIPFYAKGIGSELFTTYADEKDIVKGYYLDNTEISSVIRELMK